eukprot:gene19893-25848_t
MSSKIIEKIEKIEIISDSDDDLLCPLCVEPIDMADKNFIPCPCGYRVCMWCWHHIRENLNGLCPACRTPYNADPHTFAAVDRQEIQKKSKDKKLKQDKKGILATLTSAGITLDVNGLPSSQCTSEEVLRKPEFFGQYGKIGKVVLHRSQVHSASHGTVSAYVTFVHREDAKAAIQALDGHWIDGCLLRASFGTTKYCNNFVRGVPCNNPDCVYLHEIGDDEDRFTKEEIQAGHSKLVPTPGTNQVVVTGMGGPSGTGKRPTGEPYLPPPVFVQDVITTTSISTITTSTSTPTTVTTTTATVKTTTAPTATVTSNGSKTSSWNTPSKAINTSSNGESYSPKPAVIEEDIVNDMNNNIESIKSISTTTTLTTNATVSQSTSIPVKITTNSSNNVTTTTTIESNKNELLSPLQRLSNSSTSNNNNSNSKYQITIASAFNGLGLTVGVLLGELVGIKVGEVVGVNVGNTEGEIVGNMLGDSEGQS